jgi:hypothetical protein
LRASPRATASKTRDWHHQLVGGWHAPHPAAAPTPHQLQLAKQPLCEQPRLSPRQRPLACRIGGPMPTSSNSRWRPMAAVWKVPRLRHALPLPQRRSRHAPFRSPGATLARRAQRRARCSLDFSYQRLAEITGWAEPHHSVHMARPLCLSLCSPCFSATTSCLAVLTTATTSTYSTRGVVSAAQDFKLDKRNGIEITIRK